MRVLPFGVLSAVAIVATTVLASVTGATQPSVPDRSHYSRLAALDGAPAPARTDLDSLEFPLAKWGDLYNWRLLKPHYVTVPIEAFTTLKVPANSSPQTRAELDYLLALQQRRTEQDYAWCLKMADVYHHPLLANPADPRYGPNRDNLFVVGRDLGSGFRRDNLPKTTALLAHVYRDAMIYIIDLKRGRESCWECTIRAIQGPAAFWPKTSSGSCFRAASSCATSAPCSVSGRTVGSRTDMAGGRGARLRSLTGATARQPPPVFEFAWNGWRSQPSRSSRAA